MDAQRGPLAGTTPEHLCQQGNEPGEPLKDANQAEFQTFLEAVPDAMVVVDRSGRILMLNKQAERLFGYPGEQLVGSHVEVLVPARHHGVHAKHREAYLVAPAVRPMGAAQELYGRRKDGTEFPVEISLSPVRTEQGMLVASAIRDITERKRAEAERVALIHEQAARGQAEAANRAKDEFLAVFAHELRNPLGAVLTAVALLDQIGVHNEPAIRARAVIRRQAQRLSRLLDDLLDVTRLETGKVVLTTQQLDLAGLVQRYLGTLQASGTFDRHNVTVDCQPVWVDADAARLEQVLDNVVLNALKYTPEQGTIRVRTYRDDAEAVLEVSDNGAGMSAELLATVFDLFTQGAANSGRSSGLGVGLAVVRRLVEQHGGRVEARSDGPGRGSTFVMRFPRIDPPVRGEAEQPAPDLRCRNERRRVLVVEDDEDGREMVRLLLKTAGHTVRVVDTGQGAVETAVHFQPDVVLVDIGLPDRNGYEVVRDLRAKFGPIRLIAVTGYGQPQDWQRVQEGGFDAHLLKPVDLDELRRIVEA